MSEKSLQAKVSSSLVWKFFEKAGVQITQFVVSLVIARLLGPEEYGIVALLTVFTSLATVFVQSGLGTALVQKKEIDDTDTSSVFYYSFALAIILYFILFFLAIPIANFYDIPRLKPMLRVLALMLFPGAFNSVQVAILSKRMQFRKQFCSNLIAVVVSGVTGIALALYGVGAWALIAQYISYQVVICIVLSFLVAWRPKFLFSIDKTKSLLKYGSKLLGANLIDTLYHNAETLIIGKKYSSETLAFFNKGKMFPLTLINAIDGSVQTVMLSAYSQKQDNLVLLKRILRRAMSLNTYFVFPAMLGLAMVATPLVGLFLGEQWLPCVPFLQLYCVITMLFPMQTTNLQAINAVGRSDIYLRIMVIKRAFAVVFLVLAVFLFQSVYAIVLACMLAEVVGIIANLIPNKKIFNYRLREQFMDILANLFISVIMAVAVYFISWIAMPNILILFVQCIVGVLVYVGLSIITKNQSFMYIIEMLKAKRKKVKENE